MATKAKRLGIAYRPHFKTHQSHEVGQWFKDYGVTKIAVSSVPMAQYFADEGWNDITIAFPFVKQQATELNALATRVQLNLVVSCTANVDDLISTITSDVNVLIEVDLGQGRTGFQPYDFDAIDSVISKLSSARNANFIGFMSHAGHSYGILSKEISAFNIETLSKIVPLKARFPNAIFSYGDTPTSIIAEEFLGVDELRPGNNALFDMQQASNGVCSSQQVAVGLASPVVARYSDQNLLAVWGGAVHLSKDFYININGSKSYGAICRLNADGTWGEPIEGLYLESISQEHGMVRASSGSVLKTVCEDDFLVILPAHSCLTVDCMGEFWISEKGMVATMGSD